MTGSNRWGTGGNSRHNRKRKFNPQWEEEKRQRARDGFNLLEKPQDVQNRGPPTFPNATEPQLHRVQPGLTRLDTYEDGFELEDTTGQVNWIGAVSHDRNATWGSRVATNNADALAALCTTIQAIGARQNAPTARLAIIFEPEIKGKNHKYDTSTAAESKAQDMAGHSYYPLRATAPTVKPEPMDNTGFSGHHLHALPPDIPHGPRVGNNAPKWQHMKGQGHGPTNGPPAPINGNQDPASANLAQVLAVTPTAPTSAAVRQSAFHSLCANCRHTGHDPRLCPKPDAKYGSVLTCIFCSNTRHSLDDCADFPPNKEFANGVSMGNLSKEVVIAAVQILRLRAARPAVRSDKFFYLEWFQLAQHHGILTSLSLDKPAREYLPWTDAFSIAMAQNPHNPWKECIETAPTKPKEWIKDGLLPYDPAWEGLTLSQVLDFDAKGQLKHLRSVSLGSRERYIFKAGEEITEFSSRQLVRWGLVWPPGCGDMAGFIVLPSEILEAQNRSAILPVKREQDDDGRELHSIPAATTGGVVAAGSGDISQTITTLNHSNGGKWGLGYFLRDEMRPRWNFLVDTVPKGITKYRTGLIQHPLQYDHNDEFETYLVGLLGKRMERDITGSKAPHELPRNLLATLNKEVVEADIEAMIRAGVIRLATADADGRMPDSASISSANATENSS